MKKHFAMLALAGVLGWGYGMLGHVFAQDAPLPKWKIEVRLTDKQGERPDVVVGAYGNDDRTAVHYFDSEVDCNKFLETDKDLRKYRQNGDKIAQHDFGPRAKLTWTCVLAVKKDQI